MSGATNANPYHSPLIPPVNTTALSADASTLGLPATSGTGLPAGVRCPRIAEPGLRAL
jgi:hypothetical protein